LVRDAAVVGEEMKKIKKAMINMALGLKHQVEPTV
jgi:hypothetical protein